MTNEEFNAFLKKIAESGEKGYGLLSGMEEWNADTLQYIIDNFGHWQGMVDDNGKPMLGRLFHKMLDYKYYNKKAIFEEERVPVPFHCYMIADDDVVFTKETLEWSDEEQRYIGKWADFYRAASNANMMLKKYPASNTTTKASNSGCMLVILAIIIATFALFI